MLISSIYPKVWGGYFSSAAYGTCAKEDPEPAPDIVEIPGSVNRWLDSRAIMKNSDGVSFEGEARIEGNYVPLFDPADYAGWVEEGWLLPVAGCQVYVEELNANGEGPDFMGPGTGFYHEEVPFEAARHFLEKLGMAQACSVFLTVDILYITFPK